MKENEKIIFYNINDLVETEGIKNRATKANLEVKLKEMFPNEEIKIDEINFIENGRYKPKNCSILSKMFGVKPLNNLPPFIEIRLSHKTGIHYETILVWTPYKWNDRFMGTCGGGTSTGGDAQILYPNNLARGMTLPKAIMNHFSCASTDSGHVKNVFAFNENGKLDYELIENWRSKSTHYMAIIGKAITEILHERKIKYSYIHGGSGGGRQTLTEAQEWPTDFDGYWASCPAINWNKVFFLSFWPLAVMNEYRHYINYDKMKFFINDAIASCGGKDVFYNKTEAITYDPMTAMNKRYKGKKIISELDCKIVSEILEGPTDENGNPFWITFRPGVINFNKIIPIGTYYYPLFKSNRPTTYTLFNDFLNWVTENPKGNYKNITKEEFRKLYKMSLEKFPKVLSSNPDLTSLKNAGAKLMIDHGTCDPLIPVDGIIDYYKNVLSTMGGKKSIQSFLKLYITPGDGHGSCIYHGPGISEFDGMIALINWVEKGLEPNKIRTVQCDKNSNILKENEILPYEI